MSVSKPITSVATTEEERTWRATLETPRDGNYSLSLHREIVQRDAAGEQVGEAQVLSGLSFAFADIVGDTMTIAGQSHTVAEVAEGLARYFDTKATEAAEKAAAAAAAAAEAAARVA